MSAIRRARRSMTWLALAALLAGVSMPVWDDHPLVGDDAACRPGGPWDDTAAGLSADTRADGQPDHCVFCHLQRAMAGASPAGLVVFAVPEAVAATARVVDVAPAAGAFSPHASRAPPVRSFA